MLSDVRNVPIWHNKDRPRRSTLRGPKPRSLRSGHLLESCKWCPGEDLNDRLLTTCNSGILSSKEPKTLDLRDDVSY